MATPELKAPRNFFGIRPERTVSGDDDGGESAVPNALNRSRRIPA